MGLETASYVSNLVATNPVGATDPRSQGDDHIRLIKSVLLNTFPALNAALTTTPAELNLVHGYASLNVPFGVAKAADTDRTSGIQSNDPELSVTLQPGTYVYTLEIHIKVVSGSGPGHRGGFAFSGTSDIHNGINTQSGSLLQAIYVDATQAGPISTDAVTAATPVSGTAYSQRFDGLIRVTASGTFAYQWACTFPNGNTMRTMKGSQLLVSRIA